MSMRIAVADMRILNWRMMADLKRLWRYILVGAHLNGWCKMLFVWGYRIGIVANSDGHKGRPGASYPGAALFGAVGGLTCFLIDTLSRDSILNAIRKRHHYATTGGEHGRPLITLDVAFPDGGTKFHDDPRHGSDSGIAAKMP